MTDILLDSDNDIAITNGDFVICETTLQEVAIIIGLTKGELKSDPILGPDLIQLKKTKVKKFDIESRVRIALGRDGKDYDDIKQFLKVQK